MPLTRDRLSHIFPVSLINHIGCKTLMAESFEKSAKELVLRRLREITGDITQPRTSPLGRALHAGSRIQGLFYWMSIIYSFDASDRAQWLEADSRCHCGTWTKNDSHKKIEQFNNPAFLSIFETNISHYVYKKRQWPLVSQEMNDTLHSLHTELIWHARTILWVMRGAFIWHRQREADI